MLRKYIKMHSGLYIVLGGVLAVFVGFFAGYVCGIRQLHDDSDRVSQIGTEFERVEATQRTISQSVDRLSDSSEKLEHRIERSQKGIRNLEKTGSVLEGKNKRAGKLIEDCQRILQAIRQRGETDQASH